MMPLSFLILAIIVLLCGFAFLFCLIQGFSYIIKPDEKKSRLYGIKMIGAGVLTLFIPTLIGIFGRWLGLL